MKVVVVGCTHAGTAAVKTTQMQRLLYLSGTITFLSYLVESLYMSEE